jgi:hypothetical protein
MWVDLRSASTPVRLLAAIAKPLSIAIDVEEAGTATETFWNTKLLPEIAQSNKTIIILDNYDFYNSLFYSKEMIFLIKTICQDLVALDSSNNSRMILISQRMPALPQKILAKFGRVDLRELDKRFIIRALRYHLDRINSSEYDPKKINLLAEKLKGYPLAIGLVATRIAKQGLDVILEDDAFIRGMFEEIAEDLFSRIELTAEEKKMLTVIAVSKKPLNDNNLKTIYGKEWVKIGKLIEYQLLDPTEQGYALHSILSDYVLNSISTIKDIAESHAKLAAAFEEEWKKAPNMSASSAQLGSLSYFHSISSGGFLIIPNLATKGVTCDMRKISII